MHVHHVGVDHVGVGVYHVGAHQVGIYIFWPGCRYMYGIIPSTCTCMQSHVYAMSKQQLPLMTCAKHT